MNEKKERMEDSLNQTIVVPAEEEEEYKDPFKRLPEEIIISHILNQISDAKSLCQISLVSKYFAVLVPKTENASVKLPAHFCSFEKINHIKRGLKGSGGGGYICLMALNLIWVRLWWWNFITRGRLPSSSADPVTRFLGKFKSLRSLTWEYDCPEGCFAFEPVFKWKIMMTPSKSVCIMLLTAWSLDYDVHVAAANGYRFFDDLNEEFIDMKEKLIAQLKSFGIFRRPMISKELLVWENMPGSPENLNVLVIDSKKQVKVDIKRSDLVERRKKDAGDSWHRTRFWHSGIVQLPSSRCVMKNATLHLIQDSSMTQDEDDVFLIAKQAFDGEDEEVFVQAAFAMLKKKAIFDRVFRGWV